MRRHSRRHIVTPFTISLVVLASATAGLAWHWKWIPWELSNDATSPAAEIAEPVNHDISTDNDDEPASFTDEFGTVLALDETESGGDDTVDIFSAQSEPDVTTIVQTGREQHDRAKASQDEFQSFRRERNHPSRNAEETFDAEPTNARRSGRGSRMADNELFGEQSPAEKLQQIGFEEETDEPQTVDDAAPPVRTAKATLPRSQSLRSTNERLAEVDNLIEAGELMAAHEKLSQWYFAEPDRQPDLQERIASTAAMLFFSPQPHIEEPYVVQPGDQLRRVGKQYNVPWEFIARVNRIDPRKIRAGQKLKVITGPFTADVDISDFRLTLKWKDLYVKSYLVGVGTKGSTPLGEFVVKDKLVDPVYYGSEGDVIANDDPTNPLGERWIDIGDSYGIHGTIEPDSIGKAMSKGCIRMHNEEVEEVYDFLTTGSTVVIHP